MKTSLILRIALGLALLVVAGPSALPMIAPGAVAAGSEAQARVRAYLLEQAATLGLQAEVESSGPVSNILVRLNGILTVGQGVRIGALTGLLAGVLGLFLSLVGLAGAQGYLNGARQFLPAGATQGMNDLPAWGGWIFSLPGVIFNVGFGAMGGWIGGAILDPNRKSKKG